MSDKFGLNEIIMNSYSRQFNSKTQLSATDCAYAITSLLEYPQTQATPEKKQNNGENQNPNAIVQMQNTEKPQLGTAVSAVHVCLFDNFWIAYDALDLRQNNMDLLMKGIDLAKDMQAAIVRVGNGMIEKKEVKTAQTFRYVILENTFLKDTELFLYPLALVKLALFIMVCHKARYAKAKQKPLVISVKNASKNTCLVVAVTGPNRDSDTARNNFGSRFRDVARNLGLKTNHEGFDTNMIEMKSNDWQNFIQELAQLNSEYN